MPKRKKRLEGFFVLSVGSMLLNLVTKKNH